MSAVTFTKTLAREPVAPAKGAVSAAAPAKGFFARLLDAVIAARTEQAEREVARYMRDHGLDRNN